MRSKSTMKENYNGDRADSSQPGNPLMSASSRVLETPYAYGSYVVKEDLMGKDEQVSF